MLSFQVQCKAMKPGHCFAEDTHKSKHWQEKEEWKRIKEHPIHGKSQAKGVEGMV